MSKRNGKVTTAAPVATDQRGRVTIGNAYKGTNGWAGYYVIKRVGDATETRVQVNLGQAAEDELDAWALRYVSVGSNVKLLAKVTEMAYSRGFTINDIRTRARHNMWYNPEAALAAELADRPVREECVTSTFGDHSAVEW